MKIIPPRASIEGTRLGISEIVSMKETIRISGIERIEESSWIWSFLNQTLLKARVGDLGRGLRGVFDPLLV